VARGVKRRRVRPQRRGGGQAGDILRWLIRRCDRTYRRGNWAGSGPGRALDGVSAEAAHVRHPGEHTIAESALHMAYWKDAVTAHLTGQRWVFDPELNWRSPAPTAEGWRQARDDLATAHRRMMRALRRLTPRRLDEHVARGVSVLDLLVDIATHDTYHAAQLFVLRRLAEAAGGSTDGQAQQASSG